MINDDAEEILKYLKVKINAHLQTVRRYKFGNADFFDNL